MLPLLREISRCTLCATKLPHPPRPVVLADPRAQIVVIGQAPGRRVHTCGVPWWDPSGQLLREWLGVTTEVFYNPTRFALMPMGFCYPGKGDSGDLPPRPECAPQWHPQLLRAIPSVRLTLLIGQYSQRHYLGARLGRTLAETVRNFRAFLPGYLPLPHPSPRNRLWLRRNSWFGEDLLPVLRSTVTQILAGTS